MTTLSVIMPCYNCADTLESAVRSVYGQDVSMPFDVTMVDDGSTDGTFDVMAKLSAQHPNIRLFRHRENQGGGATRNTAVRNSRGDLIFCVDADDLLSPGFLEAMTKFWLRKRCDAVGMSTSIKFRGLNIGNVAYTSQYEGPGERVRFESFLEGPRCSLGVVFLMTRRAFQRVGGYPTEHGFDTQGMGFRFLCHGLAAYTCPDTVYYHRVEHHESYYLREQSQDRINWNWFNLLDEFLYLFRPEIRRKLAESDLFYVPGKPAPARLSELVYGRDGIYAKKYRELVKLGPSGVAHRLADSRDPSHHYWLGRYWLGRGEYAKAISQFQNALEHGFAYRVVYYRMLQAALELSGSELAAPQAMEQLARYCQPYPAEGLPWYQRLFRQLIANRLLRSPTLLLKSVSDRIKVKPAP